LSALLSVDDFTKWSPGTAAGASKWGRLLPLGGRSCLPQGRLMWGDIRRVATPLCPTSVTAYAVPPSPKGEGFKWLLPPRGGRSCLPSGRLMWGDIPRVATPLCPTSVTACAVPPSPKGEGFKWLLPPRGQKLSAVRQTDVGGHPSRSDSALPHIRHGLRRATFPLGRRL